MLNEMSQLSNVLTHHGLLQSTTHPNVNSVGKVYCLLIELDKMGIPQTVRFLQKQETGELWKHSKGNHNSFPAIRVQKPLLATGESSKIDQGKWKKAKLGEKIVLLNALDYEALNTGCMDIKISDWSQKQLAGVLSSANRELNALKQLLYVFPDASKCTDFNAKLARALQQRIATSGNETEVNFIKELLVGSPDDKTGKYISGCMTYYDVYETNDYPNLAGSSITRKALISLLNSQNGNISELTGKTTTVSSLSGKAGVAIRDKYPNPNLPILGLTYLYSKKSDIPCLTRYDMSGMNAFNADRNEINAINDAIAFLTHITRYNKTWKAISDSNRDKPNLLLAYLADDPQNDALLAQALSDPSDYESEEERKEDIEMEFDALCQQVLGSMDCVIQKNPLSKINLIILETLDAGRKQITYENSLTAEQFRSNLLTWAEAARNQPEIDMRVRDIKNKKQISTYKAVYPGPNDICRLLKMNYTRSGMAKPMKQSAISLQEIYRLYMPTKYEMLDDDAFLNDVLRRIIGKCQCFLGDIRQQLTMEYVLPPTKQSYNRARQAVSFVALISIILWRLGVRREHYMLEVPFNVGQFLQLADILHKNYCIQVRNSGNKNSQLPTQLMGNEMLAIASEKPIEGLNRLRDRMRVYLAWANTVTGEDSGLAKWILARFGEVSAKISSGDLPEVFNDAEQAQVLLGYLATIPYEKNKNKEDKNK